MPPVRFPTVPALTARRTLALLAALCAAASTQAASQVYTSEADFLAAVTAPRTETFNRFTSDLSSALGANGDLGDFTVQGSWTVDVPSLVLSVDGSTNLFIDVSYGGWADLRFDQPLKAFGAWFQRAPTTFRVDADSLAGFGSYSHVADLPTGGDGLQFIGFTSDQAFNRIVFAGAGCCSRSFAIDNVSYAAALAPVPEPEGWALLAGGLALLAWRRRAARG